jgi:hypothetical protein
MSTQLSTNNRNSLFDAEGTAFELYDLINDPQEIRSLASSKPNIVKSLEQTYVRWIEATME